MTLFHTTCNKIYVNFVAIVVCISVHHWQRFEAVQTWQPYCVWLCLWHNRIQGCGIDESVSVFYACLPSESSGPAWCLCFGHASLSEICNTSCAEWRENIVHSENDSASGRTTFLEWLPIRLVHPFEPNATSVSLRYNHHPTIRALSPLHFWLHAHISWVIWFWRDINWEFMTR